jgi:hypothetical protein
MINFHTIGDSHASEITWGKVNVPGLNIISHHLGPMTAASFGITKPMVNIEDNEWVCFCFGEIDCRDHIGKNKVYYKEITDKIVENYLFAVRQYKGKKFIMSVVPANIQASAAGDPWPCVGSDEERREYVRYFNECLRNNCGDIIFLDIHDKYADQQGYINIRYRDAGTHIIDPVFINEFLCGLL